ncbi:MAG: hypothetical protein ACK6EB_01820, partial [Planctomyces sp.]
TDPGSPHFVLPLNVSLQRLRFEVGRLKKKKIGFNAKSGARDGKREFGGGRDVQETIVPRV